MIKFCHLKKMLHKLSMWEILYKYTPHALFIVNAKRTSIKLIFLSNNFVVKNIVNKFISDVKNVVYYLSPFVLSFFSMTK